ncbi:MAG: LacI family DNA-binding transcriptional regulator [Oscillospiraceae bacterium]|nr:LacI family DNA-binding transcriptional regulator [Oscillospiraceae bacterium]
MDEESCKRKTIAYIAQAAGVSRATVSRVLTNSTKVTPETQRKVMEVVESVDYVPNIMARGLATGKLDIVGLMIDLGNPFFSELMSSIVFELQKKGYLAAMLQPERGAGTCALKRALSFGYSGLIVVDPPENPDLQGLLDQSDVPCVLLNKNATAYHGCDRISVNNCMGGYTATLSLLRLGHRRIAMLRGPLASTASCDRYAGYCKALAEYGIAEDAEITAVGTFDIECGQAFGERIIKDRPDVTAIFAGNDYMAIGVLNSCKHLGVEVPAGLSVLGIHSSSVTGSAILNLSCIHQPYEIMGARAVEMLLDRIQDPGRRNEQVVLIPEITHGATIGAPAPVVGI